MAIKETEVWITFHSKTVKHYEDRGYKYPTYKNKWGRVGVKKGTKILVKVEDLPKGSNVKVTKICDICEDEVSNQLYYQIKNSRNKNKDRLDRCEKCSSVQIGKQNGIANESNCLATTHPEFAKLFWNVEDTYKYMYRSSKKADFKCPYCLNKVENKIISNVFKRGIPCICNDGISYPEKFMYSVLKQLNIEFEFQKTFEWSKDVISDNPKLNGTKRYDFYLHELNTIIETHGRQHFKKSFEYTGIRAKTLEEEQENDRIKKSLALENEIKEEKYIVIDCKCSEMKFIKSNILKSKLNNIFDLSQIDWLKCHEFACSSLVTLTCDLWNEGKKITEICEALKLTKPTIIKYLKQGKELLICNYDAKEEIRKSGKKQSENNKKSVIQFSKSGEYICEFESIKQAEKELEINNANITSVCKGNRSNAGGFIWMYAEDYYKQIEALV